MKPGDLAYLKSSEEPVIILEVPGLEAEMFTVRRPAITQNGTVYRTESFFPFELETPEEQVLRKIEFLKLQHTLSQKAGKEVAGQLEFFGEVPPGRLQ